MKKPAAPRFLNPYDVPGRWWKVAIHSHTTNSDGHISPAEAIRTYRRLGCDAIAITDHEYVTRESRHRGKPLLIPSVEITGPPDVLYLGARESGRIELAGHGLQGTIDRIRSRGGIAIVAHPSWSGLTTMDLVKARNYAGIEVYNQVCHDLNGKSRSVELWDHLLGEGRRVWGLADDDAHFDIGSWRGSAGHAWLWVKAPRLAVKDILKAIRNGAFHGTQGPRFLSVSCSRGVFRIRTSPVKRLHMISAEVGAGGVMVAQGRTGAAAWRIDIMKQKLNVTKYARFEAVDAEGRTAWSNPFYVVGRGIRFW